jgi:hypothetical protein
VFVRVKESVKTAPVRCDFAGTGVPGTAVHGRVRQTLHSSETRGTLTYLLVPGNACIVQVL